MPPERFSPEGPREWLNRARSNLARAKAQLPDVYKVLLEDIPRHGSQLAADLRRVGAEIRRQAEKELAELYPTEPDGATPIAYLSWAPRCSPNSVRGTIYRLTLISP
jgi:hypothetical protein